MREPGWYAIQVHTGKEAFTCEMITRACNEQPFGEEPEEPLGVPHDASQPSPAPIDVEWEPDASMRQPTLLEECFFPQYITRRRLNNNWVELERPLMPGYVIAVSEDPVRLFYQLRRAPAFAKLLTMNAKPVRLREDERAWIDRWTHEGDRVIPLSLAYKDEESGELVVTDGPLVGNEGRIVRVNRRKCLAFVELHVDGKRVTTTVGLAILPREE